MEQSQLHWTVNQIYACSVERVQRFCRGTCYKKKRIFLDKIFMGDKCGIKLHIWLVELQILQGKMIPKKMIANLPTCSSFFTEEFVTWPMFGRS